MENPSAPRRRFAPALRHRDFRLFWGGQCISLVGTWMQNLGQTLLAQDLTRSVAEPGGSPLLLGILGAAQYLPMLLFSLFAGAFADRYPKRHILVVTQTTLAILALCLSVLAWTGWANYGILLILATLLGFVSAIDVPARQSYVIELAGREDLANAISLNSAAFNMARMVGPAVAGLLAAAIGVAPCFLVNAVSFIPVIIALCMIKTQDRRIDPPSGQAAPSPLSAVAEGLRYVAKTPAVLYALMLMAIESTIVINFSVLIPIFARVDLNGNASSYGFLLTSMGSGSFLAALTLALLSGRPGGSNPRRIAFGASGMSVFLALCGFSRSFALSCVLLALTGFCMIIFAASTNAHIQLSSQDSMRGRVMSLYALVFGGVTPIGNLYAGGLTQIFGAPAVMTFSGCLGVMAVAGVFLFRSRQASKVG